jgi:MFS family permease
MKVMEGHLGRRAGALREANFRKLWIGQTTSALGDGMTGVALAFAVLALSGSAADLGIVLASFMVPRVVFMLVGGVWADRLSRRAVMLTADLVRAAAQAGLAVAAFSGTHQLWAFVIAAAAGGAASAFFQPASTGLIPQTVSAGRLQQANAMLNLSQSTAFMVGPIVSGMVVAVAGAGWVFAFDAVTFLVSTASLLALRLPASEPMERGTFVRDLADGWREVASRRWLVASLGAFAFGNLAFAGFFVLAPVTIDRLYAGASDWGLLMGCFGLGGVIGGALALRWHPDRPLIATFTVLLAAPGALVLLGLTPPFAVLAAGVVVFAVGTALTNTLWHTTVQQQVPPASLSRVSSYDWMVSLLIFPLGSALAGPMADAFGARMALLVFAALAGIPLLLVLLHPAVRAVRSGAAPALADDGCRQQLAASTVPDDRSLAA